jgi:hypothetical protein
MNTCFEDCCDCSCGFVDPTFDLMLKSETKLDFTLKDICHSNIGWFTDVTICDEHYLDEWKIDKVEGVYFLWHKNGYCSRHETFHFKCLYVGKGQVLRRILNHFKNKDFSEEMLVYFTYHELPNRVSKYVEQLILDNYKIPMNRNEIKGSKTLCMYFTQSEVD